MTKKMRKNLFDGLQPTPAEHFKLYFYGAVLSLFHHVVQVYGSSESAFKEFPFLIGYNNELADGGLAGVHSTEAVSWWLDSLEKWEEKATGHLPLRSLRQAAGLDHSALVLLTTIGLIEEDLRFGVVFETMQGSHGQHRATPSLLNTWGRDEAHWRDARSNLRQMRELGLVRVVNPESPRLEWALEVPSALWDALRGDQNEIPGPGMRYRRPSELSTMDDLILPPDVLEKVRAIPGLCRTGEAQTLIVRGAYRNGRRTIFSAIARELNLGLLEIKGITGPHDERFRVAGPLATALNALPVIVIDLESRESIEIPRQNDHCGPDTAQSHAIRIERFQTVAQFVDRWILNGPLMVLEAAPLKLRERTGERFIIAGRDGRDQLEQRQRRNRFAFGPRNRKVPVEQRRLLHAGEPFRVHGNDDGHRPRQHRPPRADIGNHSGTQRRWREMVVAIRYAMADIENDAAFDHRIDSNAGSSATAGETAQSFPIRIIHHGTRTGQHRAEKCGFRSQPDMRRHALDDLHFHGRA